jgi:hypothetical protein
MNWWKEAVVAYYMALFRNLNGYTEENYSQLQQTEFSETLIFSIFVAVLL